MRSFVIASLFTVLFIAATLSHGISYAFANESSAPNPLPVITSEQLQVGHQWIWDYYEAGDLTKLYSSERYTIVKRQDVIITLEIWTLYAGAKEYTPSARFVVNLNDCFAAFKTSKKKDFKIQVYAYEKNKWGSTSYEVPSTAFEEKFNCNPYQYDASDLAFETIYEKEATPFGELVTFQQKPKRPSQIYSFYFVDHPQLKAVAYRKRFNPLSPHEFEMRLSHFETKIP